MSDEQQEREHELNRDCWCEPRVVRVDADGTEWELIR